MPLKVEWWVQQSRNQLHAMWLSLHEPAWNYGEDTCGKKQVQMSSLSQRMIFSKIFQWKKKAYFFLMN